MECRAGSVMLKLGNINFNMMFAIDNVNIIASLYINPVEFVFLELSLNIYIHFPPKTNKKSLRILKKKYAPY